MVKTIVLGIIIICVLCLCMSSFRKPKVTEIQLAELLEKSELAKILFCNDQTNVKIKGKK